MKKFFASLTAVALVAFVSCQKQQTEEEKNAEVERQVQQRLAAEHQTEQEKQLSQREADVEAREKALAEKENATPTAQSPAEQSESESYEPRVREPRESGPARGYSTFYTRLESYGDWIETGNYGYVFHPREAESSRWRPYTSGRWVYTDVGWTWISEEPFGWATYHYGRWTRLRGIGWVWVPGNQWAPAWVSWRKSSDYVGWAPLPPEARFDQQTGIHNWSDNYYDIGPDQYCFVASREFGAPRVEQTLLPAERNLTIVNQTTNVTNITYKNTTIVNEGPNYEELRSISREPVQRYRLERNVNVDLAAGAPPSEVRGETVVMAAPVIAQLVASERPRTVKQNIAQVSVDLGWAAITNEAEAKKARQKMKSEAPPPSNAPSKKFVKAAAATTPATQAGGTSTTATAAPSAAATSTPESTTTPRRAATLTPSASASSASTPISTASVSPTTSQRRGRLLVPSATISPTPRSASTPIASKSEETISTPAPSATICATPRGGWTGKGFKVPNESASIAPSATPTNQFTPRAAAPMRTPSPAAGSTSPPEVSASAAASAPAEKLTRKEIKQEKREEKKELKRERKAGLEGATASPSATP